MQKHVNVIGAGLAGCEAAWQLAKRGISVTLYEMKPHQYSPAHHMDSFAELVCSNSLRSDQLENAVGLLKEEMRQLGSLIMECADKTRVPAGGSLAVDRERFSAEVTRSVSENPNIKIVHQEVDSLEPFGDELVIVASGPLTSDRLFNSISNIIGEEYLHFFDAAAPIVIAESIDMSKAFIADRYDRGTGDYINCPMDKQTYESFWDALVHAELAEVKDLDKEVVFEGCMPVETMAKRGMDTLRFGPLKPVGLVNPHTGKEPYAVVQLRQDNSEKTLYNIVGFQTRLKWPEQKRVFSMIPGLEQAELVRYGVMHRNTFLNSPRLLDSTYRCKSRPNVFFAGQMTGVEGYVESASSGMVAGINAAMLMQQKAPLVFPATTAIGGLAQYISNASVRNFQPMNINFGIMESLPIRMKDKRKKNYEIAQRALQVIDSIKDEYIRIIM